MSDSSGALTIVFNGEIYNFAELRETLESSGATFRSHSDTEVILAAYRTWGVQCLSRLNGMFALALHDADQGVVLLARDRAGEKPLFYHRAAGVLRFASELKGLLADPALEREIDPEALDCYLMFGYVPAERCILKGFNKLPPGHALLFDLQSGGVRAWRYWELPSSPVEGASPPIDEQELLDELESLLARAVRRQLVADVPVGVLLSGGVDSSLITALALRSVPALKTFTIRFPGSGALDETQHARLIARHFGTEHVELEAAASTADLLPMLATQFDEPMLDSSMIPTFLVCQLVRRHCTVALGGDGGDELFGGYGSYSRLLWMRDRLGRVPLAFRAATSLAAERWLPVGFKGRNWLQGLGGDLKSGLPLVSSFFSPAARKSLMGGRHEWPLVAEGVAARAIPRERDLLERATRFDFSHYLAEDILVKVDRASMLNSLEVRAPMLDVHVMEFAFGRVPARLKATATAKKILLKRLTARLLPPEFDRERKQGFSIPLARWLEGGAFRDLFNDVLRSSDTIFERRFVEQLLKGQDRGRSNSERLFGLVLFELWRRSYRVAF